MTRFFSRLIPVLAACAALAGTAFAQPPACPPGYIWSAGACRPAPPPVPVPQPPVYVPVPQPPVYVPPPVYAPDIRAIRHAYAVLRSCPGDGCPPVTTLSRGTPVSILRYEGPFVLVHVPDSPFEGWVRLHQLTP